MKQYKIRSTKAVVTFYKAFAKQTTWIVLFINHNREKSQFYTRAPYLNGFESSRSSTHYRLA